MNPVLEATISAKLVSYCHILVLDSRLRDFYVPPELDMFGPEGLSNARPLLMQQVYVAAGPEICMYSAIGPDRVRVDVCGCSGSSTSSELFYQSIK
jgi:hypothetical protein